MFSKQFDERRKSIGKRGEECAARYLSRNGFMVVARNIHTRWGEIDILAMRNGRLHVVEVKTRTSSAYGDPATALTRQKFRKLKKAMLELQQRSVGFYAPWQIDFVVVEVRGVDAGKARLRFFWNVGEDDLRD
jgi:putative endonuclease